MLISCLSTHYTSHAPGSRPSRSHAIHKAPDHLRSQTMHQAAGHHDPTLCTVAAGREYRLFRARALRPGNERGCVEPPELERSPQLVTAGRDVRRWCLHSVASPAILHFIPCHLEHCESSPPTSPPPTSPPPIPSTSIYLPPTTIPPCIHTIFPPPAPTLSLIRRTPFSHIIDCQQFPFLLRGKFPKAKSQHSH